MGSKRAFESRHPQFAKDKREKDPRSILEFIRHTTVEIFGPFVEGNLL